MIPLAVVVPEARVRHTLRPLIEEAEKRDILVLDGALPGEAIRVAVGLDGFVPKAEHRVAVDNWFDCWRHPPDPNQTMCYSAGFHFDVHHRLWGGEDHVPSRIVGCLWADGRPLRAEEDRPLAIFFTPKMVEERRARWFRSYYWKALEHAQQQAEREGLTLVVKTRAKHRDPWWIRRCRQVVSDETSSPELLRRARWCVHFGSAAALEACAMGAFAYWYPAPEGYLAASPGTDRRPAMFCYPGVSRMGAPNGSRLDPVARARFLDTYVGALDGQAAARVLDVAEGL